MDLNWDLVTVGGKGSREKEEGGKGGRGRKE